MQRRLINSGDEHMEGVDHVGVQDNFLEVGGHSLHAMKLTAKAARQLNVELSVHRVLEHHGD